MSYHIISNLNIKSKSSEFDQLNLFAEGVFLFLWLTYLLSRKPNCTRPFLLLSLWWMTKVSCIALTETGTRVELRVRKTPSKTLAENKFTRYWCNFCWIKSEKMVVFDIGYSYSHVCVCSLGRITHLVHQTDISFKFKTILICIANSIKYIYAIYIYMYLYIYLYVYICILYVYIYVCLCGKDHIHHIPYLFCLSHISITFINKTNPSNSLKRKKYWKHSHGTPIIYACYSCHCYWSDMYCQQLLVICYIISKSELNINNECHYCGGQGKGNYGGNNNRCR